MEQNGSTNCTPRFSACLVQHAEYVHRWGSFRPSWWRAIWAEFDVELDCHNAKGGPNNAPGVNWGPQRRLERAKEAPFTLLNRFKSGVRPAPFRDWGRPDRSENGSRSVLAFMQCDICQILAGWQAQAHKLETKFVLVGDMDQDFSVLGLGSAIYEVPMCHNVHNPIKVLHSLLEDPRLVLWVVAQHT